LNDDDLYNKKLEKIQSELNNRKLHPEKKETNRFSGLFSYAIEVFQNKN